MHRHVCNKNDVSHPSSYLVPHPVSYPLTGCEKSCDAWPTLCMPNPPTNIIPTNIEIVWVKLYGNFPMDLGIPPLIIKIMLESNPLKSIMLVWRLAVKWHTATSIQKVGADQKVTSSSHWRVKPWLRPIVYIPQMGVQWKQGVVIHMMLYTSLWYNTTPPSHCTPL